MEEIQEEPQNIITFPSPDAISTMKIAELVQLKAALEKYELFLARKIRSIIQT